MQSREVSRLIFHLVLLLALSACSTLPSLRYESACKDCIKKVLLKDSTFPIVSMRYSAPTTSKKTSKVLHIYLEGDGRPWLRRVKPAENPTGKRFLALNLLQSDPSGGYYIARPCYGMDQLPEACEQSLWTNARYSETVVMQMQKAIDLAKTHEGAESIRLFGHSGGGTLAMLIAARRTDVKAVVTIAANLDHEAWTSHHQYDPLVGSLNAAHDPPLPFNVTRVHLIGKKDKNVLESVTRSGANHDPLAQIEVFDAFSHLCCWEDAWPKILERYIDE